jgi:hypothetical protein
VWLSWVGVLEHALATLANAGGGTPSGSRSVDPPLPNRPAKPTAKAGRVVILVVAGTANDDPIKRRSGYKPLVVVGEHDLAKVGVEGLNPFACSNT